MAVVKDEKYKTWTVRFRYKDWQGETKEVYKRGFITKREALEWETAFKMKKAGDMEMTFADFVKKYKEDHYPRIKFSTSCTKDFIIDNRILTGSAEYTSDGRLLGHAMIGIMMIEDERRSDPNYDPERVKLLQHMLASHHGQLEFGAITTPAIPEATVLHALDMIDSRIYMFNDAYKDMDEGMLSGNIYGLENSSVYKAPPAFYYDESNEYWDEQVRIRKSEQAVAEYRAECEKAEIQDEDDYWLDDSETEYEW